MRVGVRRPGGNSAIAATIHAPRSVWAGGRVIELFQQFYWVIGGAGHAHAEAPLLDKGNRSSGSG